MEESEKIQKILLDIQWLRDNVNRLLSNAESEKDVRRDTHLEMNKRISELDKFTREVFYDPERGFLVRIDRLTQESLDRKKMKQQIVGLWITILVTIISVALNFVFK